MDSTNTLSTVPEKFQKYFSNAGFTEATPVQSACWPYIFENNDVRCQAKTGSGKTLAFLLPILMKGVQKSEDAADNPVTHPRALIVLPTRELCLQVLTAARPLAHLYQIDSVALYGGKEKSKQLEHLRKLRPIILLATPGRLLDVLSDRNDDGEPYLSLTKVDYLVLDEADKLLALGFEEQINEIERNLPKNGRQTLLFSATFPPAVSDAATRWMRCNKEKHINIDMNDVNSTVNSNIEQVVHLCAEHKKPQKLMKFLFQVKSNGRKNRQASRVLIFVKNIKTAKFLCDFIRKKTTIPVSKDGKKRKRSELEEAATTSSSSPSTTNTTDDNNNNASSLVATTVPVPFRCALLHGKMNQDLRELTWSEFKAAKIPLLVATDVASRGLHVPNLPYVVNYDFPANLETYIHRIGRTGRGSDKGMAFSFFTRNLQQLAPDLVKLLQDSDQKIDTHLKKLSESVERISITTSSSATNSTVATSDIITIPNTNDEIPATTSSGSGGAISDFNSALLSNNNDNDNNNNDKSRSSSNNDPIEYVSDYDEEAPSKGSFGRLKSSKKIPLNAKFKRRKKSKKNKKSK